MSFARAADRAVRHAGRSEPACPGAGGRARHRAVPAQARSIELTAAGARYLPPIRGAFELISDATETNAPALRGLKFRVGIASAVQKAGCPAVQQLLTRKASGLMVGLSMRDEPALVADGHIHALLRTSDKSCGGLTIERVRIRNGAERFPAVLVTRPGLAGCRQHRALVKLLYG